MTVPLTSTWGKPQLYWDPVALVATAVTGSGGAMATLGYAWSPSLLMPVMLTVDASGNLNTTGVGGSTPIQVEEADEAIQLDNSAYPVIYIGKAAVGSAFTSAVWKVSKLTVDSYGGVSVLYASGSALYDQIWNNRTSLTYS